MRGGPFCRALPLAATLEEFTSEPPKGGVCFQNSALAQVVLQPTHVLRAGQPNLSALRVYPGVVPQQLELRRPPAPLREHCVPGLRILRERTQKIHDSQPFTNDTGAPPPRHHELVHAQAQRV